MYINERMIRVKILKDYKKYEKGSIELLTPNEAFGLIDKGVAIISKDITSSDTTRAFFNKKKRTK